MSKNVTKMFLKIPKFPQMSQNVKKLTKMSRNLKKKSCVERKMEADLKLESPSGVSQPDTVTAW